MLPAVRTQVQLLGGGQSWRPVKAARRSIGVADAGVVDRLGEGDAVTHRRQHLLGEGLDFGHECVGRLVRLAGRGGEIPAVHEPVEDDEAGEGLARDLAEGGLDRPLERTRAVDRLGQP